MKGNNNPSDFATVFARRKGPLSIGLASAIVVAVGLIWTFGHFDSEHSKQLRAVDRERVVLEPTNPRDRAVLSPEPGSPKRRQPRLSRQERIAKSVGWTLGEFIGESSSNIERFSTLNYKGKLSPQIVAAANLSSEETKHVQDIFDKHRNKMLGIIAENVVWESEGSGDTESVAGFTIKAFPEEGSRSYEELRKALDSEVDEAKREILLSALPIMSSYSSYGLRNTHVKILKDERLGEGMVSDHTTVELIFTDPVDSMKAGSRSISLAEFEQVYGRILETINPEASAEPK